MARSLLPVLGALLFLLASDTVLGFTLTQSDRKISAKTTITRVTDTLQAKNTGSSTQSDFVFCYPQSHAARLAHLKVKLGKEKAEVAALKDAPAGAPSNVACFKATLSPAVKKGATANIEVLSSYTDVMKPNPANIAQGEKQLLQFDGVASLLTPYSIETATAEFVTPGRGFISHGDGSKSGDKATFGPHSNLAPWEQKQLKVHFEHPGQFKRANKLVKEIQISMWGNIYVEEVYEVQNAGSKHTGKFSRLQYAHGNAKGNSWQNLRAKLPPQAHTLYYKDLIGNISSSNTQQSRTQTTVDLEMRYPLMGGWKTDFTFGYSLPLEGFLYRRPDGKYRLLMDFGSPIEDLYIDDLEVRVVLPEGAEKISWTVPVDVDQSWDKKYTYLDTQGRPVLVLKRGLTLPVHNQPFAVDFQFTTLALLREPVLLVSVFAVLFFAAVVWGRLDFTITKDKAYHASIAREKARGVLQELQAAWEEEATLFAKMQRIADSLTDTRAAEAAGSVRADLEDKFKQVEAKVKEILGHLDGLDAKLAAAAHSHAAKGRELQAQLHNLVVSKIDAVKKGGSMEDIGRKVAATRKALWHACTEWATRSSEL